MSKLNNFNISATNTNISYRNYVIPDDEYENGEFHHPWALPLGYGQQDGCGNGGGIVDHRENKFVFPNAIIKFFNTTETGYSSDLTISYNIYEYTKDKTYKNGLYVSDFSRGERYHGYDDGSGDDEITIILHNI